MRAADRKVPTHRIRTVRKATHFRMPELRQAVENTAEADCVVHLEAEVARGGGHSWIGPGETSESSPGHQAVGGVNRQ
jgi:dienelactone hydrolase